MQIWTNIMKSFLYRENIPIGALEYKLQLSNLYLDDTQMGLFTCPFENFEKFTKKEKKNNEKKKRKEANIVVWEFGSPKSWWPQIIQAHSYWRYWSTLF